MKEEITQEILDELFSSLQTLETQSAALVQFMKEKGLANEQELAPYFEQARTASAIRWRASRVRIEHLLAGAAKAAEQEDEKDQAALAKTADSDPGSGDANSGSIKKSQKPEKNTQPEASSNSMPEAGAPAQPPPAPQPESKNANPPEAPSHTHCTDHPKPSDGKPSDPKTDPSASDAAA